MNSNYETPIKEDDLPWWDKPPVEDDEDDLRMVLEVNGKEVFDFRENKLI